MSSNTLSSTDTRDDQLIPQTASEFASFLNISTKLNVESADGSIDDVLTRLDELYGMLDMIRSDNALAIDELLPQVQAYMTNIKPVFEQIDQLEKFVEIVKQNVYAMEKEVKLMEDEFSTFNSFKKAISGLSFLGLKKKSVAHSSKDGESDTAYITPEVFRTSDYLIKGSAGSGDS